jgi:hypothetical protein
MVEEQKRLRVGPLPLAWTLVTCAGALCSIILGRFYSTTAEALWGYEIVDNR